MIITRKTDSQNLKKRKRKSHEKAVTWTQKDWGTYWHFCVQSENYQIEKTPFHIRSYNSLCFLKTLTYSLFLWNWVILHTELATISQFHIISCDITVYIRNSPNWPSPALVLVPQPPPSALALWPRILAWWQICWHHHMFTPIHMHTQYNPSTEGRTKDLSLSQ